MEHKMEETSCELWDGIYEDGSVKCIGELEVCIRCSEGIWERISESDDSEVKPGSVKE